MVLLIKAGAILKKILNALETHPINVRRAIWQSYQRPKLPTNFARFGKKNILPVDFQRSGLHTTGLSLLKQILHE